MTRILAEWENDFHKALNLYCSFHSYLKDRSKIAILGGCFLSWAGEQVPDDWDIYMGLDMRITLEDMGYKFSEKLQFPQSANHMNSPYARHRPDWLITEKSIIGREQIILIPESQFPVWRTFDYLHCMLGLVGFSDIITAGAVPAAYGWFLENPSQDECRPFNMVAAKARRKKIWGKQQEKPILDVIEIFRENVFRMIIAHENIEKKGDTCWSDLGSAAKNTVDKYAKMSSLLSEHLHHPISSSKREYPRECYVCETRGGVEVGADGVPRCGRC